MARLKSITIENYRSIGEEPITINFPENQPVILKSYIFILQLICLCK